MTVVASVVLECVGTGVGIRVGVEAGTGAAVSNSKASIHLVVVCSTLDWIEMGSCVPVW
jgi:hypothetical protein